MKLAITLLVRNPIRVLMRLLIRLVYKAPYKAPSTFADEICHPTQWHLGPYAIAFGTLRNGIWDPTQWHWVQPCRQVRTASSDRRVELKPSLTPAREALVRIIENPTGVFQWFSAFVSVKIRVSAKITRTAWRHRGDETLLSFTSAVPESCVR